MTDFPVKFSVTYNNLTYYSDDRYIIYTNSTGGAKFNFNATCESEYSGAPKFAVGDSNGKQH